jgi:aryl-alcohol dehydrogenase-like predicted oxidoreductase
MKALHNLVQSGKVRYIGASSMWTWQFAHYNHVAEKVDDPEVHARCYAHPHPERMDAIRLDAESLLRRLQVRAREAL